MAAWEWRFSRRSIRRATSLAGGPWKYRRFQSRTFLTGAARQFWVANSVMFGCRSAAFGFVFGPPGDSLKPAGIGAAAEIQAEARGVGRLMKLDFGR